MNRRTGNLSADNSRIGKDEIARIVNNDEYPETSAYTLKVSFLNFTSYGKKFTQVVVFLSPQRPRNHNGKKVVVVAFEGGSEYAMDFLGTVEGKEDMGVWLARRGVTFIALNRVGRWNFLAKDGSGSSKEIRLEQRMPIFNRDRKTNWSPDDYFVTPETAGAALGRSRVNKIPKPGTELHDQMLAATPLTALRGFKKGLHHVLLVFERQR